MGLWIDNCLLDKYILMQYLPPKYKHVLCFRKDDLFLLWSSKWYILANKCVCIYLANSSDEMTWIPYNVFFSYIPYTPPQRRG